MMNDDKCVLCSLPVLSHTSFKLCTQNRPFKDPLNHISCFRFRIQERTTLLSPFIQTSTNCTWFFLSPSFTFTLSATLFYPNREARGLPTMKSAADKNLITYHFTNKICETMNPDSYNTDSTVESSGSEGDATTTMRAHPKKKLVKLRASSLSADQVEKALRKRSGGSSLDNTLKKLHSSQSNTAIQQDARSEVSRRSTRSASTGRRPRQPTSGREEVCRQTMDRRRSKSPGIRNRSVSRNQRKKQHSGQNDEKCLDILALPPRSTTKGPSRSVDSDSLSLSIGTDGPTQASVTKRGILRTKSSSNITRKSSILEGNPSTGKKKSAQGIDLNASLPSLSASDERNSITQSYSGRKETATEMVMRTGIITQNQLDELIAAGFLFIKV